MQWKYFLHGIDSNGRTVEPQPSYKIDTTLGRPLGRLPESVAKAQELFGADPQEARSLPVRNLLRGLALSVPTGQDVARAMGVAPLELERPPGHRRTDPAGEDDETDESLRGVIRKYPQLEGNWPLWYYVLKEGGRNDGAHLGPVGGRIVAEVLIGLLSGDRLSYINVEPNWKPTLGENGRFTLSDLINFGTRAVA